jgi:NAD(P)-dependent dehydrogenase (short-subunit alcohol dehydrogenase family)
MAGRSKAAIVTEGTSGIGAATARALATAGTRVFVASRHPPQDDLLRVPGIRYIATDIVVPKQVARLVNEASADCPLDYAINCAGYEGLFHTIDDYPDDDCKQVLDVNVLGTFFAMKHQVRAMRPNKVGAIVNLASIVGLKGVPTAGPYSASKHAVIGLTRSAALETVADGIRINAVAPSLVNTAMADRLVDKTGASKNKFTSNNPMQRIATTDDVVSTILWLLSDSASFMTGQTISVDGGQSIA